MSPQLSTPAAIRERVTRFVEGLTFLDDVDDRTRTDESRLDNLLDSLGTLQLVVFLEETYGIQVTDGELTPENFGSVRRIADLVGRKAEIHEQDYVKVRERRMKLPTTSWDVVVVGGGPAGSSAAGFLAMEGLKVLLVEESTFPRFHIGESLAAASWPIWRKLGVADELDCSGQIIKQGAEFNLFGRKQFFYGLGLESPEYFPDNHGKFYAFQVVRADFDKMMLDNTRRLGVEVLQPATVEQIIFNGTQATGTVIVFPDGERVRVSARVVVDATGRDSFLARRLDLRHPDPKLNKISYFAHFEGAWRPRANELPVWVHAFEGGWVWYIPLMNDLTSVGVLMDTEYARTKAGRDPQQFFRDSLARAPIANDWIANARQVSDLKIISALSYFTDRCVGDGWLLAGDAAIFVDPIFSSGVHIAMKCGDYASRTIAKAFALGDFSTAALFEYEAAIRLPQKIIFPMIYGWYDTLRQPNTARDILEQGRRFPSLRKRINATLGGAYEAMAGGGSFVEQLASLRTNADGDVGPAHLLAGDWAGTTSSRPG